MSKTLVLIGNKRYTNFVVLSIVMNIIDLATSKKFFSSLYHILLIFYLLFVASLLLYR